MAKVTDLNGCFVRVDKNSDLISSVCETLTKIKTRASYPLTDRIYITSSNDGFYLDFHSRLSNKKFKEIYFNDGEFFDEPMVFQDSDLLDIPWTDGSIDEQESSKIEYEDGMRKAMQNIARTCGKSFAVDIGYQDLPALVERLMYENKDNSEWSNGDDCVWSGTKATFIGYSKSHGSRCAIEFLRGNCSVIETVFIEDISKPETEAEKKTRELAEEVNRICYDLFGTPAFDCNQDIIDTVEKFVINGYKKVD